MRCNTFRGSRRFNHSPTGVCQVKCINVSCAVSGLHPRLIGVESRRTGRNSTPSRRIRYSSTVAPSRDSTVRCGSDFMLCSFVFAIQRFRIKDQAPGSAAENGVRNCEYEIHAQCVVEARDFSRVLFPAPKSRTICCRRHTPKPSANYRRDRRASATASQWRVGLSQTSSNHPRIGTAHDQSSAILE